MRYCVIMFSLLLVLVLVVPSLTSAAVLIVDQDSGPYYNIKSAIAAAARLDTVRVMPGTYTGTMNTEILFNGIEIALESSDGPDVTIIDCENTNLGFYLDQSLDPSAIVRGLTVRNAQTGGGIRASQSILTIEGCLFEGNYAAGGGGGIATNTVWTTTITNCTFVGNDFYQIAARGTGEMDITGCVIAFGTSGGPTYWAGAASQ